MSSFTKSRLCVFFCSGDFCDFYIKVCLVRVCLTFFFSRFLRPFWFVQLSSLCRNFVRVEEGVPDSFTGNETPRVWEKENGERTERKERRLRVIADRRIGITEHVWRRLTSSESQRPTNEPYADHLQSRSESDWARILWPARFVHCENKTTPVCLHGSAFQVNELWGSPHIHYLYSCSRPPPPG